MNCNICNSTENEYKYASYSCDVCHNRFYICRSCYFENRYMYILSDDSVVYSILCLSCDRDSKLKKIL